MKKLLFVVLFAISGLASAADLGVVYNRDYAGSDRNAVGLTLGKSLGAYGVTAGAERFSKGNNDQNRYSLVASYDLTKIGSATVSVKAGAAYLDNQIGASGYAALAGVGISIPVAKAVAVTVDARHQAGQNRVESFNGNTLGLGLKYSF